jgi:hypothetical protein
MRTKRLIGLIAAIALCGCSPSPNNAVATEAAPEPTNAATASSGLMPGARPVTADDPVVCCQFGGARGSSIRSLCAQNQGTERPRSECPGM